jgi:predicted signal transduction protein with EAL and GGDEF domain
VSPPRQANSIGTRSRAGPELPTAPDVAFQPASAQGRLAELDQACRYGAIDRAIAFELPAGFKLFVNLEPSVLGADTAAGLVARAGDRVDLMVEITERALTRRPAELLRAVEALRAAGCAIALDDVGGNQSHSRSCPSLLQMWSSLLSDAHWWRSRHRPPPKCQWPASAVPRFKPMIPSSASGWWSSSVRTMPER